MKITAKAKKQNFAHRSFLVFACLLVVAQYLHDKGCNVEHIDDLGQSAVHHAAMFGHTHTLKYLVGVSTDMQ